MIKQHPFQIKKIHITQRTASAMYNSVYFDLGSRGLDIEFNIENNLEQIYGRSIEKTSYASIGSKQDLILNFKKPFNFTKLIDVNKVFSIIFAFENDDLHYHSTAQIISMSDNLTFKIFLFEPLDFLDHVK